MRKSLGLATVLGLMLSGEAVSQEKGSAPPPNKAPAAQSREAKPVLAVRLESKDETDGVRITVFLENLTDKPRDHASPSFSPWPCLKGKVDGAAANLEARAAFAFLFDKPEERTIEARKRLELGDVMVIAKGRPLKKDEPLVPVLYVEPGKHEVELSLKKESIVLAAPGAASAATVKVTVK